MVELSKSTNLVDVHPVAEIEVATQVVAASEAVILVVSAVETLEVDLAEVVIINATAALEEETLASEAAETTMKVVALEEANLVVSVVITPEKIVVLAEVALEAEVPVLALVVETLVAASAEEVVAIETIAIACSLVDSPMKVPKMLYDHSFKVFFQMLQISEFLPIEIIQAK